MSCRRCASTPSVILADGYYCGLHALETSRGTDPSVAWRLGHPSSGEVPSSDGPASAGGSLPASEPVLIEAP